MFVPWKKGYDIALLTKICIVKAMVFPIVKYGCESWAIKMVELQRSWCLWTVVLEKTFEGFLDGKEIKPVNPKGNQPWILIRRTDAEDPILWPTDVKSWLIGKDPDAGKDWRQKEKGLTEDKMVVLNGHGFEPTPRDSEGQGSLACCSPWGSQRVRHNWITAQQCGLCYTSIGHSCHSPSPSLYVVKC